MTATPPDYPAGQLTTHDTYSDVVKVELIDVLRQAPSRLAEAVSGLNDRQLNTLYRNWSIRQIVHHIADSHVHSYIRFKWALTEHHPTIKAYDEADWVQLADSKEGTIAPALALLTGLHAKWVQVLDTMPPDQYARTFRHPQTGEMVSLWHALNYYPWHSRHHTGQILWLCRHHGWRSDERAS